MCRKACGFESRLPHFFQPCGTGFITPYHCRWLISWVGFMAEQLVKIKRRSPQVEQEREQPTWRMQDLDGIAS